MSDAARELTADAIRAAAERLRGQVLETPCLPSRTLSAITGCEVYLKFENLQFTASFKERGALNKLVQLTSAQRACGVLAVSAGNQAQGVAYHAERLGIAATIVMPLLMSSHTDRDEALANAERLLVERGVLKPGDTYAITVGEPMGYPGGTNMLKVCRVG